MPVHIFYFFILLWRKGILFRNVREWRRFQVRSFFHFFFAASCKRRWIIIFIFILQRSAIRFIYKLGRRDSLRDFCKEANILTDANQSINDNIMLNNVTLYIMGNKGNVNVNTRNKLSFNFKLTLFKQHFVQVYRWPVRNY